MSGRHWRRFLPSRKQRVDINEEPEGLSTIRSLEDANLFIERLKSQTGSTDPSAEIQRLHSLLIAQTPRAALAQIQMDKHKHGYHNRDKRLYELIDFNDTLVSLVLLQPPEALPGLDEALQKEMNTFCARLKTPVFTPEQFEAIVRGLSREIAVFRAAKVEGFQVHMTSRVEDAFGIDMIITDPQTGKQLNIDCKTPPAFRHRLEDLVHDGRINEQQLLHADEVDYITVQQRRNQDTVPVTLLCIRPDTLGSITNFTFDDAAPLGRLLHTILADSP